MHLALTGLFRAKWTAEIHEEWMAALLEKRPDLSREKLERTRALMDKQTEHDVEWERSLSDPFLHVHQIGPRQIEIGPRLSPLSIRDQMFRARPLLSIAHMSMA